MKNIEPPGLFHYEAEFEELCLSIGSVAESLQFAKEDMNGIDLAGARLSNLRTELEFPQYYWHRKEGYLVANDHFALTRIFEQNPTKTIVFDINDKGRVSRLSLIPGIENIDELALFSELQRLDIDGFIAEDSSPLIHCPRLNTLELHNVHSQMVNLESTLKDMPWLSRVTVTGFKTMNLTWATDHRELALLRVPGLKIEDITPLSNCLKLVLLEIPNNPISSLAPLKSLPNLLTLDIRWTRLSDLRSAYEIESLLELSISSDMVNLPNFRKCNQVLCQRGGRIEIRD